MTLDILRVLPQNQSVIPTCFLNLESYLTLVPRCHFTHRENLQASIQNGAPISWPLSPLLSWLMSTEDRWLDCHRFTTLVADVRKAMSYPTNISTFKGYTLIIVAWNVEASTLKARKDRPQLTMTLPWIRCTDSSLKTAKFPKIK